MHRPRKHIDTDCLLHMISVCLKYLQIARKARGLAGNVDDTRNAVLNDLWQRFRMNAVSWRVQNDQIRLFLDGIQYLQYISRDKLAVM